MIDENVMKKEIFYELVCANAKEDTLAFFIGSGFTDGFKLETGDFLAKNGHVHFCLEDETVVGKVKKNFGWRKVYREYPTKYTLIYESNNKQIKDGYTRVYRYVGR